MKEKLCNVYMNTTTVMAWQNKYDVNDDDYDDVMVMPSGGRTL